MRPCETLEYKLVDPWIIEKIKKDEEINRERQRPYIQPEQPVYEEPDRPVKKDDEPQRGVIKINIFGDEDDFYRISKI